jgi:hypothetical protein
MGGPTAILTTNDNRAVSDGQTIKADGSSSGFERARDYALKKTQVRSLGKAKVVPKRKGQGEARTKPNTYVLCTLGAQEVI